MLTVTVKQYHLWDQLVLSVYLHVDSDSKTVSPVGSVS